MKSGVLGLINGPAEKFESENRSTHTEDEPLEEAIEIRDTMRSSDGHLVQTGRAATEKLETEDAVHINEDSGSIQLVEETVRNRKYTEFIAVPSEFVAVKSGAGVFAFDLLAQQHPELTVSPAEIDLESVYERSNSAHPWQVGFYGNIGNAEKGVVYGEDVFSDTNFGNVLQDTQLNQLGLRYEFADETVKTTMAESGYVETYQPSNWDAAEFADFVISEILPATSVSTE